MSSEFSGFSPRSRRDQRQQETQEIQGGSIRNEASLERMRYDQMRNFRTVTGDSQGASNSRIPSSESEMRRQIDNLSEQDGRRIWQSWIDTYHPIGGFTERTQHLHKMDLYYEYRHFNKIRIQVDGLSEQHGYPYFEAQIERKYRGTTKLHYRLEDIDLYYKARRDGQGLKQIQLSQHLRDDLRYDYANTVRQQEAVIEKLRADIIQKHLESSRGGLPSQRMIAILTKHGSAYQDSINRLDAQVGRGEIIQAIRRCFETPLRANLYAGNITDLEQLLQEVSSP